MNKSNLRKMFRIIAIVLLVMMSVSFISCESAEEKEEREEEERLSKCIKDRWGNVISDEYGRSVDILKDNYFMWKAEDKESVYLFKPAFEVGKAYYTFYVYDKDEWKEYYKNTSDVDEFNSYHKLPEIENVKKYCIKTDETKHNDFKHTGYAPAYLNNYGIKEDCVYSVICSYTTDESTKNDYTGKVQCVVDYETEPIVDTEAKNAINYNFTFKSPNNGETSNNKLINLTFKPWSDDAIDEVKEN